MSGLQKIKNNMNKTGQYTHDGVLIFHFDISNIRNGINISSYSSDELTESNIAQQTACFIKWLINEYPLFNSVEFGQIGFKILR